MSKKIKAWILRMFFATEVEKIADNASCVAWHQGFGDGWKAASDEFTKYDGK